ncbi:MAG: undecaprenyl-diphosphatase UppP [Candidatus Omnitrophica bacterium]|nr:undecaprenyl-diphosphatase UppP [Candidatus Omnitrophota bacterium]MDD5660606.1 undecaprenyl-diphosphatase UppP [Candidatus Omnitrophota bacterium]
MHFLDVLIFGVVEGITEFLPVSSTGHLMLTAKLLKISQSEFIKSFQIAIQLGAVLSVVILYWNKLIESRRIWKRLLIAFLPAAFIGGLLYTTIKRYLLGNNEVVLWSLLAGGLFLIVFELFHHEKEDATEELSGISYLQALIIGLFQSVAIIPGVSRAAATIIGGLAVGLKRKTIVEFSFLLAVPTMLAATTLDLFKSAQIFTPDQFVFLGAGFIISFLVAIIAIKFLLAFIKRHSFIPFGIYRIIISLVFWFILK